MQLLHTNITRWAIRSTNVTIETRRSNRNNFIAIKVLKQNLSLAHIFTFAVLLHTAPVMIRICNEVPFVIVQSSSTSFSISSTMSDGAPIWTIHLTFGQSRTIPEVIIASTSSFSIPPHTEVVYGIGLGRVRNKRYFEFAPTPNIAKAAAKLNAKLTPSPSPNKDISERNKLNHVKVRYLHVFFAPQWGSPQKHNININTPSLLIRKMEYYNFELFCCYNYYKWYWWHSNLNGSVIADHLSWKIWRYCMFGFN